MAAPTRRPSKTEKSEFRIPPLTSLIDTVTIIMFYLMTQMSTTAVFEPMVASVPQSSAIEAASKGITFGIDKQGLFQETDAGGTAKKTMLADAGTMGSSDFELPTLRAVLDDARNKAERRKQPLPNITLQVDSTINYNWVLKVMNIAGELTYKKVNFIVVNPNPNAAKAGGKEG